MSILELLKASANGLPFLTEERLVRRAKLVEDDFKAIGLKYQLGRQEFPVQIGAMRYKLPFEYYQLLDSQCNIKNAREGDQCHTSMGGGGLDRECLLYFSKISEWAHEHIPNLWPNRMKSELKDPNQHLNTLCEVWWLSHFAGVDYSSVKHDIPITLTDGKKVDWEFALFNNLKLRVEVKRRVGDFSRRTYQTSLKVKSIFADIAEKFPNAKQDSLFNVGCITLFGPIDREVRLAAVDWLTSQGKIDCLCFSAPSQDSHETFWVLCKDDCRFLKEIVLPRDEEDDAYFAPCIFRRSSKQIESARLIHSASI